MIAWWWLWVAGTLGFLFGFVLAALVAANDRKDDNGRIARRDNWPGY